MIRAVLSVADPRSWFGPIFFKEMLVSGRRSFSHWARLGTGLLLAFVLAMVMWSISTDYAFRPDNTTVTRLWSEGQIAPALALAVGWVMCIVLPIVAAAYGSGTIIDEKRARTLDSILATPMSAWTIVAGKVTSRLVQTLLIALIALPVLLAARTYGGIDLYTLLAVGCVTACQAVFATCVASWFSMRVGNAWAAMASSVFVVVLVNALPWLIALLGAINLGPTHNLTLAGAGIALHTSPFGAIAYVVSGEQPLTPTGGPILFRGSEWIGSSLSMLALSVLALALSARYLRRMTVGKSRQRVKRAADGSAVRKAQRFRRGSRTVVGPPVAWRELRQPIIKGSLLLNVIAGALLLLLLLAFYISVDRDEMGLHITLPMIIFLISMFVALPATCGAIAGERETRSLEVLLCTPVSAFSILLGKFLGGFVRPMLVAQIITFHALLYTAVGVLFGEQYFTLLLPLHVMLITLGTVALLSSSGIFFAVVIRRTLGAMLANIGLWAIVWMGLPLFFALVSAMTASDGIMDILFAMNPVMMVGASLGGGVADWSGGVSYEYDGPSNWNFGPVAWTVITVVWCVVACSVSAGVLLLASRIFAARTLRRS